MINTDSEVDAFEEWAVSEKMNMDLHPLHYLFLDSRTYAARKGWKAGLNYASKNNAIREAAEEALEVLKDLPATESDVPAAIEHLRAALGKN